MVQVYMFVILRRLPVGFQIQSADRTRVSGLGSGISGLGMWPDRMTGPPSPRLRRAGSVSQKLSLSPPLFELRRDRAARGWDGQQS